MFKRIFVNLILAPFAIAGLYAAFAGTDSKYRYAGLCLGIGLIGTNINWCRNHIWRNKKIESNNSSEDFYRSTTYCNLDNVESNKIGNTLKRGSDLRK